jgi:cellulose biosynthesis protein BcsQ
VLIGLVSAKGSPGVTTAALTFAAVLGIDGLLIELDPSGGSIECWTGTTDEPGLVRTASALRRSISSESLVYGIGQAPDGVSSILAPTSGVLAESAVAAIGERLSIATADLDRTVIVDAGSPGAMPFLSSVIRPSPVSKRHAPSSMRSLPPSVAR